VFGPGVDFPPDLHLRGRDLLLRVQQGIELALASRAEVFEEGELVEQVLRRVAVQHGGDPLDTAAAVGQVGEGGELPLVGAELLPHLLHVSGQLGLARPAGLEVLAGVVVLLGGDTHLLPEGSHLAFRLGEGGRWLCLSGRGAQQRES